MTTASASPSLPGHITPRHSVEAPQKSLHDPLGDGRPSAEIGTETIRPPPPPVDEVSGIEARVLYPKR
jgi:hypothetical protein